MRGRNPSADSAAGMAGGGRSRLHHKPFWRESGKSQGLGDGVPIQASYSKSLLPWFHVWRPAIPVTTSLETLISQRRNHFHG